MRRREICGAVKCLSAGRLVSFGIVPRSRGEHLPLIPSQRSPQSGER